MPSKLRLPFLDQPLSLLSQSAFRDFLKDFEDYLFNQLLCEGVLLLVGLLGINERVSCPDDRFVKAKRAWLLHANLCDTELLATAIFQLKKVR